MPKGRAPLIVALVVAAASAVVFAVLWARASETDPAEVTDFLSERSRSAEPVAERVIDLLMNYDSDSLEGVSDELLGLSTGNFREQYQELLPDLGPALERAGASSRGEIVEGPDVAFVSDSQAVALARVRQTTRSESDPAGRTITYTIKVTLVDTPGEGWKADRVDILSQS